MILAHGSYGTKLLLPGIHPRKELMDKLGYRSARRIYRDTSEGKTFHVGYIVGSEWFDLWDCTPHRKEV